MNARATWYAQHAGYRQDRPVDRSSDAVLLLHGLGGDRDQLWPLFPTGRRVIVAADQRAHGPWPFPLTVDELTFDQLARDQLALMDRLHIRAAGIAGVSMGAGVALALARLAPERVTSLLLIRPAWLDRPFPANLEILVRVGEVLERGEGVQALTGLAEYRAVATSPAAAASVRGQFDQDRARALALRLRQLPASVPVSDLAELQALDVPTTIVAAENDPMHPADYARSWAEQVPGSVMHTVPSRDADPDGYGAALRRVCAGFVG